MKSDHRISLLLAVLDQAFDKKAWHGPVLLGALRGVGVKEALFRPHPKRNSIRDLIQHCAYWKFIVRRILEGGSEEKFPRSPCNFPLKDAPLDARLWAADLKLLKAEHQRLRSAVEKFPAARLAQKSPRGVWTLEELIHGVAAHDLYHAGQVSLLKRLARSKPAT